MKSDIQGCSTCKTGKESYESFYSRISKVYLYQYNYRDWDGTLFSCVGKSLIECREKRDEWLKKKTGGEKK